MSVVGFPKPERLIFACGCGCSTLFLYDNGNAECPSCGTPHEGAWKVPADIEIVDVETSEQHKMGEPVDIMKARFIRMMDQEGLLAAVQFFNDGRVNSVILDRQADTDKQKAWWRRGVVYFLRQVFLMTGEQQGN